MRRWRGKGGEEEGGWCMYVCAGDGQVRKCPIFYRNSGREEYGESRWVSHLAALDQGEDPSAVLSPSSGCPSSPPQWLSALLLIIQAAE